jgi:tRNA A37 threonylcarbamoyladenosine dehydratase
MGTGNKLDPTKLVVTDIYKTSVCPLAKVMRRELKKRDVKRLKVVYSTEEAMTPLDVCENSDVEMGARRQTPGSNAFVPASAGLLIGSEVIKDLIASV